MANNLKDFETYQSLLKDIRWKAKTLQIKDRDNNKCLNCGSHSNLQVHHRQYHFIKSLNKFKNPWDYSGEILITLCKQCHDSGHKNFKVPTLTI
jgi:5-methylcytosine-specific restriction endonuclease McrA